MREHIRRVGVNRLIITYLIVLLFVFLVEAYASYNIHILHNVEGGAAVLRDIFSMVAVIVAAFTVIANVVFAGGKTKADREFHYYFRTRPLWVYSATAVIGDVIAIFLAHNTGYAYTVFFTSLLAINIIAILFAIHAAEKAIRKEF